MRGFLSSKLYAAAVGLARASLDCAQVAINCVPHALSYACVAAYYTAKAFEDPGYWIVAAFYALEALRSHGSG